MTATTGSDPPGASPLLLHDFFERAARRHPDAVALDIPPGYGRADRRRVTYAELRKSAAKVAALARPVVAGESVVAIYLPRHSPLLFAAQLGVLKAGAAFTCIDPAFPEARVREILDDSRAAVLLTDGTGIAALAGLNSWTGRVLDLEKSLGASPLNEVFMPPAWLTGTSLAYVIYTSGTTGHPKGVMVEHRAIVNLVESDVAEFGLGPEARVAQTSSPSYDSSIEEIWLAYGASATVVVADDDTVRLGPDLVPWLRRERVTVLCPTPTLLRAAGCENPREELPELALVYAGGEAMPQDLADRWAPGRRLENGYGPTECAVTALRGTLQAGKPVHIGRPVPGLRAWALDADLEEVSEGHWGELCIGGAALARGYWNQPELTAQRFVTHPRFGRIFRTGDLVHREPGGVYMSHGRADAQVKIRGHRVELEEIEARLSACPGVRTAACRLQKNGGQETLVGFVIPENPDAPPSADALQARLGAELPSYMVPARIGLLTELPATAGGKLNRSALPRLESPPEAASSRTAPRDQSESILAQAFRAVLGLNHEVSTDEDFFTGLGGDSLRAAELITRLRKNDPGTRIAVRDLYETRTIQGLAARMKASSGAGTRVRESQPAVKAQAGRPVLTTLAQSAALIIGLSVSSAAGYLFLFGALPWLARFIGLVPLLLLEPALAFLALVIYALFSVFAAVVAKRVLIGRYRPMSAPAWGAFYLRNWIVERVAHAIPWWLIVGTGFQSAVLRALGARVGRRVHIHYGVDLGRGGWDLLEIGDDVMIGQEAFLGLVELESGQILISPVVLGDGATVETRGVVSGGACMERGSYLTALSSLPRGTRIPAGERWDGVPAAPAGEAPLPEPVKSGIELSPALSDALLVLASFTARAVRTLIPVWLAMTAVIAFRIGPERAISWLSEGGALSGAVLAACAGGLALCTPLTLAFEALVARALGTVQEGVIGRRSWEYVRVRFKTELARSAGDRLAGSVFWPGWLRWAGATIGSGCEISTLVDIVPEMIEIGRTTFLADGIYLGGPRLHRGTVTLALTRLGSDTFLGNHVVIGAGQKLQDGILLGICTVADDRVMRAKTSWFGHPPFELPKREVISLDARLTYRPDVIRYLTRLFWELMRLALPIPPALAAYGWLRVVASSGVSGPALAFGVAPLATLGATAALCLLTLATKWALLGRVKPGQHAFWSCWCGRWDFVYVAWEDWARAALTWLESTLLLSWYLRAMGVTLGKRVVLGPGMAQVVDPDMLVIEDGATVCSMFQAHTFEDRVLKIDRIRIGRQAALGSATVPLYGADIGEGAWVEPGSVVMKHEHLLPGVRYAGAPAHESSLEPFK